jgi:hypothetical protein
MARDELGTIPRGQTAGAAATTDLVHLEGVERWFEDIDYTNPPKRRSNRRVLCRLVRNVSGVAIKGKRLVLFKAATGGKNVDGYAATDRVYSVPADEFLPSGGAANSDLFWIVLKGPAIVTTSPAANAENVITEGDIMVALTAAASTHSTTAGRVVSATWTGANSTGAVLANNILNCIGRALSAATTANSDSDLLVDVSIRF